MDTDIDQIVSAALVKLASDTKLIDRYLLQHVPPGYTSADNSFDFDTKYLTFIKALSFSRELNLDYVLTKLTTVLLKLRAMLESHSNNVSQLHLLRDIQSTILKGNSFLFFEAETEDAASGGFAY